MFEYQNVKLIGITNPIEKNLSSEDIISYCARVSNPQNQTKYDTSEKLLKYLIINKHWSPFEMVNVVLEIETTRDIARQILRHRSFSFQEFSQRYADPTKDLGFTVREVRLQDQKNRQNSIENKDKLLNKIWLSKQKQISHEINLAYKWAIENGIAKEQARAILPEGLTISRMYMNGTLRSWITYIAMREKNGTQKEHRDIALKCKKIICDKFPSIKNTLGDIHNEWNI
jgi:thymidylate synthase (FAD)